MASDPHLTVGVSGGTGNIGSRVIELLTAQSGDHSVIALSRRPLPCNPSQIRRNIDYNDEASLKEAFEGLDILVFPGSDGDPDDMLRHHRNVIAAASRCNVRRIVYLSTLGVAANSPFSYARVHHATEELLRSSNMDVCVLRASIFAEFFIGTFIKPALTKGMMQVPIIAGRISFISRADVAAALADAIMTSKQDRVFNLTGPEALGYEEIARQVTDITGQPLKYKAVGEDAYRSALEHNGIELCYVEAFTAMLARSIPNGSFELVSEDVTELTGRKPERFTACLLSNIRCGPR